MSQFLIAFLGKCQPGASKGASLFMMPLPNQLTQLTLNTYVLFIFHRSLVIQQYQISSF